MEVKDMKAMGKFMEVLKEGNPITYKELVERVGIPRSHVSAYMHRIKKLHEIEETMDGPRKVFRYLCKTEDKLNILAQNELRKRAEGLLVAKQIICHRDLMLLLNIDFSSALCLIGYLVDTKKANMQADWKISVINYIN